MIGTRIGHYSIEEKIGEGGMGVVYKALDTRLLRPVAIKILPSHLVSDPQIRQRFEREAIAASALNHPNICTIHEIDEVDGVHFIVMEFVDGEILHQILARRGPLPEREVLDIGVKVCDALGAAHAKGIIHRDIKPDNIMISREGYVKVMDFGLAKLAADRAETMSKEDIDEIDRDDGTAKGKKRAPSLLTRISSLIGTVSYMSPEQADGKPVDHRTDIFSSGVVLYELLTGQLSFQADSNITILSKIIDEEPPPILNANATVSPQMAKIVNQMLQKDPSQRYQNFYDLVNVLKSLRDQDYENTRYRWLRLVGKTFFPRKYLAVAVTAILLVFSIASYYAISTRPSKNRISTGAKTRTYPVAASIHYEDLPAISPDGSHVAYISDESGNLDIWVKKLGETEAVNVTENHPEDDTEPAWSPDGTKLVFRSDREGGGLFVTSLDGGQVSQISKFGTQPSWSPNGKQIAFTTLGGLDRDNEVYVVEVSGGEPQKVLGKPKGFGYGDVSWSPGGNWFFFILARGSKSSIWAYSIKMRKKIEILKGDFFYTNPSMSNNMKYLYFRSDKGGGADIWRMTVSIDKGQIKIIEGPKPKTMGIGVLHFSITPNADKVVYSKTQRVVSGREVTGGISSIWLMTADPAPSVGFSKAQKFNFGIRLNSDPEFSPNGKWIAFESDRSGKPDIWVVSTFAGNLRRVTSDQRTNTGPSWSPDGQWLVYDSGGGNLADIRIISVNGGEPRQLFHNEWADWLPDWSPDGEKIIFTSNRTGNWDIWQTASHGASQKQLTSHPAFDFCPKWSPDGEKIAFISSRSGVKNIWIMSPNGKNPRQITYFEKQGIGRAIGWDPTGDKIYFCREIEGVMNIFSIGINSNHLEQLTYFDRPSLQASDWGGLSVFGKKIVFSGGTHEGDIWVIENFD